MWMVSVEELRGSMEMVASRAGLEEVEDVEVEGRLGEALCVARRVCRGIGGGGLALA